MQRGHVECAGRAGIVQWFAYAVVAIAFGARSATAQDAAAVRLHQLVNGLTVTPRVLIIGAHPDDDDPLLIAWLARGHGVETAFLSLTRGEAGDNFIGIEGGTSLGAVRTQESLAARRIDGGISFFTRAVDFGVAKNADIAFARWSKPALVADIARIIRSFRPQIIVTAFSDTLSDGNGQHATIGVLARDAYEAAADSLKFPSSVFGAPWSVAKLYRYGNGLVIDAGGFDPVLGKTYADLALESRAQHRSQGLLGIAPVSRRNPPVIRLVRAMPRTELTSSAEQSIFDGVDTTFARFADSSHAPADVARLVPTIAAYADSARHALDLRHPSTAVGYLSHVVQLATAARAATPWCKHPSQDAAPPAMESQPCETRWLDLEASVDLVRRRAVEALVIASQVTVRAVADRELIAETDTVDVSVAVSNHGDMPITLNDVSVSGAVHGVPSSLMLPPDSTVRFAVSIANLAESRPWWISPRKDGLFEPVRVAVDGVHRTNGIMLAPLVVPGVVVPEELHRTSDVVVSMTIAGATFTTSVGPVTFRAVDPMVGMQERAVGAAPAVTLAFERGLEWFPAGKPIDRQLRLSLKSFSDLPRTFSLKVVAPITLRVDSLPSSVTLAPGEQRELFVHLRGTLRPGRHEFGIVGQAANGEKYLEGFLSLPHQHIPPVNFYHSSAMYFQAVDIEVPSRLVVAYVPGVRDDLDAMLRQLGVPGVAVNAEDLLSVDLSKFTTLVIGPRAYEVHRELGAQNARLLDFVRAGGTMVVLNGQYPTTQSGVLAYPAVLSRPAPEHVTVADAPVTVLDPTSRLFTWPNAIEAKDWMSWVGERALFVPTATDPHYTHLLEAHDPGEKENRNSLLVTQLGKGTYIYSTLTFSQQLPGGVPGGARLLVNLLSAGCRPGGGGRC